jgi:uncharacterized protein (TIGR03086 family)
MSSSDTLRLRIEPESPRGARLMTSIDIEPATRRLADLVGGVRDEQLGDPTPCPEYTLGDLLDHVGGLALAFTAAATKATGGAASQGPSGDAKRLGDDWRIRIPRDLAGLAEAWRDPAAWSGTTRAGGIELPGEVAGLVALDEVMIHAWDVARSSGQAYDCDPGLLEVVHGFVAQFSGPGHEAEREGLFGPEVEVPQDAPLVDRVIGLAGRAPAWSPR